MRDKLYTNINEITFLHIGWGKEGVGGPITVSTRFYRRSFDLNVP